MPIVSILQIAEVFSEHPTVLGDQAHMRMPILSIQRYLMPIVSIPLFPGQGRLIVVSPKPIVTKHDNRDGVNAHIAVEEAQKRSAFLAAVALVQMVNLTVVWMVPG